MATQLFRDERLVPGVTEIRAIHVVELRNAIGKLLLAVGLPTVWAGVPVPSGEIPADVFAWRVGELSPAQRSLPTRGVWNDDAGVTHR
jgi:hypothetical protein